VSVHKESGSILKLTDIIYSPNLTINLSSTKRIVEGQKVVFKNDLCLLYKNDELQLLTDTSPIAINVVLDYCAQTGIEPQHSALCNVSSESLNKVLWQPSSGHLKLFGCDAYNVVPTHKRDKFIPTAEQGTFVGYNVLRSLLDFLQQNQHSQGLQGCVLQ
jgi:hypothetical protein